MELFGFSIKKKEEIQDKDLLSFAPTEQDDGALLVTPGGSSGIFVDMEGGARTEAELITKYRSMYLTPECQSAVDKIVNEAIVQEEGKQVAEIVLDGLQTGQRIKDAIKKEWRHVTDLLHLNQDAYTIFLRWYVDGRLTYQKVIDSKDPRAGIQELRYLDPRKVRKVRTQKPRKVGNIIVTEPAESFWIYNDRGFGRNMKMANPAMPVQNQGLKISDDLIIQINSGLLDENNQTILGWLHKAIKPLNMLRMLEDATVIYRVSRAAERRLFYVDVGQLPKAKAEQYLKDMMIKHKNRLVYDATSGEVRDDRKYQTMYEDMWFPTRGGDKTTRVETLPAGQNLGELSDVNYFKSKLFESLNLPLSRMQQGGGGFNLGRASEISRDELEFQKFVTRMRVRFSGLFLDILGTQLILKGVLTDEDWDTFKDKIWFEFARDNYTAELKDAEILTERLELLSKVDDFDGKYFSRLWAQRNILKMSDEEISKMAAEIDQEKAADAESVSYQNFDTGETPGTVDPMNPVPTGPDGQPIQQQPAAMPPQKPGDFQVAK